MDNKIAPSHELMKVFALTHPMIEDADYGRICEKRKAQIKQKSREYSKKMKAKRQQEKKSRRINRQNRKKKR